MTNSTEWGKRAYQDRPDSQSWGGKNVFDVYTTNSGTGSRRHQVPGLVESREDAVKSDEAESRASRSSSCWS